MSYDIRLRDPVTKETLETDTPHQMKGGTYALGGTSEMWLNITYNYSRWYARKEAFGEDGIRSIYGMSGAKSIPVLTKAITGLEQLDEDLTEEELQHYKEQDVDGYWLPTRENTIRPLYQLLAFAQLRPDGVWDGD